YPAAVTQLYLGTTGLTQRTKDLARQIVAEARADNPYDKAVALTRYLQSDGFTYSPNAFTSGDPHRDAVDFFLFDEQNGRIGFCEQYASAMVEMARSLGIPARLAAGFAPGQRIESPPGGTNTDVVWAVRKKNAHAWAELYFPGYGWQVFEATKTIEPVQRLVGRPAQPSGGESPGANGTPRPIDFDKGGGKISGIPGAEVPLPGSVTPGDSKTPTSQPNFVGSNILMWLLLLAGLLGYAVWRWRANRRQLRFLAPGDRQWRRLTLAADRAGVAQRPSETILEYAGWLEEQLPSRGPEIRTIAEGKVWHSYSGRGISGQIIARMEDAWKRLQLPLVWLAVRRRVRGLFRNR
ncbi:MAG TPA: transglutaminase domain-containing protein, partial [Candidatus Limnocylindria bacterium]